MSSRNAQRKHAKATQRKKILEQRRRLEPNGAGGGLAHQVRRAAAQPLHACHVQDSIFQTGVGMVFLSRKTGARDRALSGFLVDAYCLGVKDAMFRELDEDEMDQLLDELGTTAPLIPVDPPYARKLLRDAAAYAESLGLPPHPDYPTAELLFGDVAADACGVTFEFGHEGRPLYVPGPGESPTQIRRRIERLRLRLGDDGFDFDLLEDAIDELDDGEMDYDPDVDPDPAAWLALDEGERLRRARDCHERYDPLVAELEAHAAFHVAIENQIAMGDETPAREALERLMAEGLSRHEAVHALGSVLAETIVAIAKGDGGEEAERSRADAYNDAIARITAEDWRLAAED